MDVRKSLPVFWLIDCDKLDFILYLNRDLSEC